MKCSSCRYWDRYEGEKLGRCRIDPPKVCEGWFTDADDMAGVWPAVDENQWCGEWKCKNLFPKGVA